MKKRGLVRKEIDLAECNRLFEYIDGILYYNSAISHRKVGQIAGSMSNGRWRVSVKNNQVLRSRVVFLMHNGFVPTYIDHIDRDKLNDRIENLRECTCSENNANRSLNKNKRFIYRGVTTTGRESYKKFRAVMHDKVLGVFDTQEQAALAYNKEAVKRYGDFAILNIIPIHFKQQV